jgi:hypothetical protein
MSCKTLTGANQYNHYWSWFFLNNGFTASDSVEWRGGIVWYPVTPAPTVGLNKLVTDPATGVTNQGIDYARPSSAHPGGFVATMCDGSSRFLSEDIEYRVYALVMAPASTKTKNPTDGSTELFPPGTAAALTFSDADLNR